MKIVDERPENKKVPFKDLGIGDVFEYNNSVYMKMHCTYYGIRAIRFNDCFAYNFDNLDTEVIPLNVELVIRGDKHE